MTADPWISQPLAAYEASSVGRLQIVIVFLCAVAAMVDGFDTQAIALVAPAIAASWYVPAASFGPVFGIGLFGGTLGAMIAGAAGDRFGRKPALLTCVAIFAIAVLLTPRAHTIGMLCLARFVTGIGLGGALPSLISITTEYAPPHRRAAVVSIMFCGFPLGAGVGGAFSASLVPAFGWQSIFYGGGMISLLLLPVLYLMLPESLHFMLRKGNALGVAKVLKRGQWMAKPANDLVEVDSEGWPFLELFRNGHGTATLLLGGVFFLSLLLTYFLVNWLPLTLSAAGVHMGHALLGVAALNLGSVLGCVLLGLLGDRVGMVKVIGSAYLFGSIGITLIGQSSSLPVILLTTFVGGFLSIGAQICTVALSASFFALPVRGSGVGWCMGIGRIGAMCGPLLGGLLVGLGMSSETLFLFAGLTSVATGLIVLTLGRHAGELDMVRPHSNLGSLVAAIPGVRHTDA